MNNDINATWHYHNGTKHPHGKLIGKLHTYDPAFRPNPYKVYKDLQTTVLPLDKSSTSQSALITISSNIKQEGKNLVPDLNTLAKILYFSCGITKTINYPRLGDVEFRAAACTGALFHIEIYVVCGNLPSLSAGVYHFDPKYMKIELLRKGDYRRVLINASSNNIEIQYAPLILIYSDVFTRNTIKYQTREYRHAFWDCGTIIANTLAISSAHKLPAKVILGYEDDLVNSLIDLNTEKEVSLALVPIGFTKEAPAQEMPVISSLNLNTEPLSNYDFDDQEIQKIHQSSSLASRREVKNWLDVTPKIRTPSPKENSISLDPFKEDKIPPASLEQVIIRRGSTREFLPEPVSFQQLSTILFYSTTGVPADFLEPYGSSLINLYLIINAVDGLQSGSYFYNREQNILELLKGGKFRQTAGYLGLDQDLPADGSVAVFFMTDLETVLQRFGNRGYRAAQLEASILGGKFYLTSYAQNLGATGLTFYDDAVTEFFSPHAKDKSVMFMVVLGKKRSQIITK